MLLSSKCFETRFVRGSSIVPVLSRHATLLLSCPDLSRKIEGPLLAGYKNASLRVYFCVG